MTKYLKMPERNGRAPVSVSRKIEFADVLKMACKFQSFDDVNEWYRVEVEPVMGHLIIGAPNRDN